MSSVYDLKSAQYEYEQRLRDAEHDRQVRRMENVDGKVLAKRVAKVVGLLVTALGLK